MTCQAYGCSTRPSNGKSLHSFPDPVKKKELCQTWIYNLNLQEASFTSTKNKVVCEDHFETSCFEGNMMVIITFFLVHVLISKVILYIVIASLLYVLLICIAFLPVHVQVH